MQTFTAHNSAMLGPSDCRHGHQLGARKVATSAGLTTRPFKVYPLCAPPQKKATLPIVQAQLADIEHLFMHNKTAKLA